MYTLAEALNLGNKSREPKIIDLSYEKEGCHEWDKKALQAQIDAVANYLAQIVKELEPSKEPPVIGFSFHNSIEIIVTFLAIAKIGCVALPLNFNYTQAEYEFFLSDVEVSLVIKYESPFVKTEIFSDAIKALNAKSSKKIRVAKLWIDTKCREFHMSYKDATLQIQPDVKIALDKPESVCLILHTSGTTSRPKAVPLTQHNISTSMKNIMKAFELTATDCSILTMPLFHIHGIVGGTLAALCAGSTIVIQHGGKFSASAFWKDASRYNITYFSTVPTILHILTVRAATDYPKSNPPKLRFIRSSSSSLPAEILKQVEKLFETQVLEAYSMTEASHQMTSNPLKGKQQRKIGTVGIPQNVEVVILDSEGNKLPPGLVGEVCIRGENVTKGYLNNPSANEEAFKYNYFHTGDLGEFDNEGYLTLRGRIKELVNRGGEKINPAEVDEILLKHPQIAFAATFAGPDSKYGECVCCAIVAKDSSSKPSQEDIIGFCGKYLSGFKIPTKIFFTDELPRTATGKIQRKNVAAHFLKP